MDDDVVALQLTDDLLKKMLLNVGITVANVAGELVKFMDAVATAAMIHDERVLYKIAFVWSQRRDRILSGEEAFEDQKIEDPVWLGRREPEEAKPSIKYGERRWGAFA